jgi:trehalose 6-phosphate phosphatase
LKNLLESWDDLAQVWVDKKVLLFLDYDGTLTPIAASPLQAVMSLENKELIEHLVKVPVFKVVIISGRMLANVKQMVGIEGVIYVGNHGWEIEGSSIHFESLIPVQFSSMMAKIKYELITQLSDIQGVFVEDKGVTLSVHYRLAGRDKEFLVRRIFEHICMPYRRQNEIKIYEGKKVLELRPPIEWDKGKAALWLLRKHEVLYGRGNVLPVYIGDDSTDEDAFEALKDKGITALVGSPKRFSAAQYYLPQPQEVTELLKYMVDGAHEKL